MKMKLCPFCMKEANGEQCSHCGNPVSYSGDPMHLQAGHVLLGKHSYILGAALGQGGFGITYIALDMENHQRVAVKEYFPTYCAGRADRVTVTPYRGQEEVFQKGRERFLDEARMLKSLSDLNSIVNVLDFFETNHSAYLVMEFLEGDSLKAHAQKHGKFPAQTFLKQLCPLMEDIERMHQRGVVHRDIAPDNIILTPDGQMKLIDFGAARSYVGDKSMTVVVKKGFAPIEQYMRHGSTAATDVYALAATIYYCITGTVPPDSAERQYDEDMLKSPISLGAELSREQERAIVKALEVQPKKRTQSVAELIKALEHAPKPEKPKSVKKTEKPKAESQKKPKWIIPAIAAVLICIIGAVLFLGKESPAAPAQTEPVQVAALEETVPETTIPETEPPIVLSEEAQKYNEAVDFFNNGEYGKAAIAFAKLGDYQDAKEISLKIWDAIADRKTLDLNNAVFAVKEDGTAVCGKIHDGEQPDVSSWTDVIAVSQGTSLTHVAGLCSDGTVLLSETKKTRLIEETSWTDMVSIILTEEYVFGLKSDGTVAAYKINEGSEVYNETENLEKLEKLQDVVKIRVGKCWNDENDSIYKSAFPILWIWTADGTVLRNFELYEDQTVIDVRRNYMGTTLLKKDGTVSFLPNAGEKGIVNSIASDISEWNDIVSLAGSNINGGVPIWGLKADGTVMVTSNVNESVRKSAARKWTNIVVLQASYSDAVGLKFDGTVCVAGSTMSYQYINKIKAWKNIRLPADRDALLAAIDLDYITEE